MDDFEYVFEDDFASAQEMTADLREEGLMPVFMTKGLDRMGISAVPIEVVEEHREVVRRTAKSIFGEMLGVTNVWFMDEFDDPRHNVHLRKMVQQLN
jgi:hypothetical protein